MGLRTIALPVDNIPTTNTMFSRTTTEATHIKVADRSTATDHFTATLDLVTATLDLVTATHPATVLDLAAILT
jgi:hypothetical protein